MNITTLNNSILSLIDKSFILTDENRNDLWHYVNAIEDISILEWVHTTLQNESEFLIDSLAYVSTLDNSPSIDEMMVWINKNYLQKIKWLEDKEEAEEWAPEAILEQLEEL